VTPTTTTLPEEQVKESSILRTETANGTKFTLTNVDPNETVSLNLTTAAGPLTLETLTVQPATSGNLTLSIGVQGDSSPDATTSVDAADTSALGRINLGQPGSEAAIENVTIRVTVEKEQLPAGTAPSNITLYRADSDSSTQKVSATVVSETSDSYTLEARSAKLSPVIVGAPTTTVTETTTAEPLTEQVNGTMTAGNEETDTVATTSSATTTVERKEGSTRTTAQTGDGAFIISTLGAIALLAMVAARRRSE
jgi:hypothetical protein